MRHQSLFSVLFFLVFSSTSSNAQTVEVLVDGRGCSGFIGKLTGASQIAYLFTAGHCIPGVLDSRKPNKLLMNFQFDQPKGFLVYQLNNKTKTIGIQSPGIVFATLQKYDVAILRVSQSVNELVNQGIDPYLIGFNPSIKPVFLENGLTLENAECLIEAAPFLLTYQAWKWTSSMRLSSDCHLHKGWSGSVVADVKTHVAIGILSGGNETGRCDDYCENTMSGRRNAYKGRSYFTSLEFLKSCVSVDGKINPEQCGLSF